MGSRVDASGQRSIEIWPNVFFSGENHLVNIQCPALRKKKEILEYSTDDVAGIAVESVPTELLTTPWEAAEKALRGIKIKKAPGLDGLPNVVLKEFAHELGPVISDMYNASLRQGFLSLNLRSKNV